MTGSLMVGVSGVRGIVGTDLTRDVVMRYAAGFGTWAKATCPRVVLGRDSRASGRDFAAAATTGLVSVGCEVVDVGLAATPTIQLAVGYHRAGGGIAITASHNPIEWNALKFVGPDGIFLDGAAGARVRELAEGPGKERRGKGKRERGKGKGERGKVVVDAGAGARHLAGVLSLPAVNVQRIRERGFTVALDAVRGAGGPLMKELLEQRLGCTVYGINLETDGQFPRPPEPVPENLSALGDLVRRRSADVGMAVDPDVDRLAIVDEQGRPIGEDYTLAFAVRAVLSGNRETGNGRRVVVCNLSTSLVVDDAARDCGAAVVRTPVGEAHVARRMLELGALIGGEGNGGVMYPALHVGRDAPVAAALVLELLARTGKRVSEIVEAAPRYAIVKAKAPRGTGRVTLDRTGRVLELLRGAEVDTQDGVRLGWRDRWLHVRPSNTEPIIRLIAEAPSEGQAQQLVDEGRRLCAAS